ncbi:hypothetical protein HY36_00485 [Hyphomonas atlantica]|uniref:Uncharacterized protein n=1 Tax=Hyphomonas atlantica TaxID=1280948 RepID=A0A059EB53_9PROT|nr:hypothetical protein HY36_00485 [Hyphomonas atlantica]
MHTSAFSRNRAKQGPLSRKRRSSCPLSGTRSARRSPAFSELPTCCRTA